MQRLVHEVPNESALVVRIFANQIPIFLESAFRISHRMGIFALDKRFARVFLTIFLAAVVGQIHRAINIRVFIPVCLFVLYRARFVFILNPFVASLEVRAESCLVSERPEDDRRMVESALHVTLVAFHVCLRIKRVLGERFLVVAHTVRFDIRLGHYIETIFIAEVVPKIIIRIVACADGVNIQLFHPLDILPHPFLADDVAFVRIHLVAVCAFKQNSLSVHQDLSVFHFYLAETDFHRNRFDGFASVFERSYQLVEVRSLSRPFRGIADSQCRRLLAGACYLRRSDFLAGLVEQFQVHRALALQLKFDGEGSVLVLRIQIGSNADVFNLVRIAGIEITVATYTAEAQEVLVFQI